MSLLDVILSNKENKIFIDINNEDTYKLKNKKLYKKFSRYKNRDWLLTCVEYNELENIKVKEIANTEV